MVGKIVFTFFELTLVMLLFSGVLVATEDYAIAKVTGLITGACFISMCAFILVDVWSN